MPNQEAFVSVILKTFSDGLQAIKCFERWSKHADLLQWITDEDPKIKGEAADKVKAALDEFAADFA